MATVTDKEKEVLKVIHTMTKNNDPGFSDVMIEDICDGTGFDVSTVKGLLGSLEKKKYIDYMDVNDEYNVYFLKDGAKNALK